MRYETRLFVKDKYLVKVVKKCFLKKTKYLASIYKSDILRGKLQKMTIYKRVYLILKSITPYQKSIFE